MRKRVFVFAEGDYAGSCGGGTGVAYLLMEADRIYHLLREPYFVFNDMVVGPKDGIPQIPSVKKKRNDLASRMKTILSKVLPVFMLSKLRHLRWLKHINAIEAYYINLDNIYKFSRSDSFVFHNMNCAFAFRKRFPFCYALIYHRQGDPYYEWKLFTGYGEDNGKKKQLIETLYSALENANYCCFPSKGTADALLETAPEFRNVLAQDKVKILYNGVNCPSIERTWQTAQELDTFVGFKFITIAMLNYAKGVERIPQYLGAIAQAGIDFRWVVIGNGVMAGKFQKAVAQYGIEDKLVWIQEYISHDKIQQILSVTDFYILFHRYSIFDLSTLEAMGYGNIPILTPVGGNKEMIVRENGLFVTEFDDISDFKKLVSEDISKIKQANKALQREQFSQLPFLQRYVDLCNELVEK